MSESPGESKGNQRFHVHSDDRPCLDFGWKVDHGVEKLNRPSSDFQIHSLCDEILVSNGTSMNDVLGDWCDFLSFNLTSEEIVMSPCEDELDIITSCDSAASRPQCAKVIRTIRGQPGDICCWAVAQVLPKRVGDAQSCRGMPWEHREYQTQMSWKKMFAADDVVDVNLG